MRKWSGLPIAPSRNKPRARERRIEDKILEDLEPPAAGVGGGYHPVAFGERHRHGFLNADVRAGGERRNRHRLMQGMRRQDFDEVEVGPQQICEVARRPGPRMVCGAASQQRRIALA
jgi:hypothetical protein